MSEVIRSRIEYKVALKSWEVLIIIEVTPTKVKEGLSSHLIRILIRRHLAKSYSLLR